MENTCERCLRHLEVEKNVVVKDNSFVVRYSRHNVLASTEHMHLYLWNYYL